MSKNKTIIIAPAIKTKFWKQIYKTLSKGKSDFHLIFVGHVKPSFKLPPNFTYIYCDLPAAACVEIAYRYAYKNIKDAEYIVNIADDLWFSENFIEEMASFYNEQQKKYNTDLLLIGPTCLMGTGEENLMATHDGGPSLLAPAFTTIENSKKIGGVDRRFQGIYWDCDRALRMHLMGGKVIFASCEEMTPVSEKEHVPGLYYRYKNVDRGLLDELWYYNEGDTPIVCAVLDKSDKDYEARYGRKRNNLVIKSMDIGRVHQVNEFSKDEIGKYYE
jgi:hypothetical protein